MKMSKFSEAQIVFVLKQSGDDTATGECAAKKSRRPGHARLCQSMKEIAATRVRYGYRRIHALLRREGWRVNSGSVWPYGELGLKLRNKTPRGRVKAKLRDHRRLAARLNQTYDRPRVSNDRYLRVMTIVNIFARF